MAFYPGQPSGFKEAKERKEERIYYKQHIIDIFCDDVDAPVLVPFTSTIFYHESLESSVFCHDSNIII